MNTMTVAEIAELVEGTLIGSKDLIISRPEQIDRAENGDITFIGSRKFAKKWEKSKASAAIINKNIDLEPGEGKALIQVKNADLAMAKVLEAYAPELPSFDSEIHPNAVIHETAALGKGCKIGAGCYVGAHVSLGDHVSLYPNATILDHTRVGSHCTFWSGTVIRERTVIGNHCTFHNNVSIGADGFGYRPAENGHGLVKVPQIGNVVIGNYVEIGANSCVDRGKFSSTVIGDGCKIDNLVQIGHNSVLGRFCIMAGASGLAGSVTLGDGVVIGGSASIKDHTTIGSGAVVGAGSGVLGDIPAGKKMLGYPAVEYRDALKQWVFLKKAIQE